MMHFLIKKQPVKLFALLLSVAVLTSCKKSKNDDDGGFPKTVNIEYRVTTTTSGLNKADVNYTNETGGMSVVDDAAVPLSKKITKKVNQYEVLVLSAGSGVGGNLKLEILVNDKLVKTETFTGTSIIYGTTSHQF